MQKYIKKTIKLIKIAIFSKKSPNFALHKSFFDERIMKNLKTILGVALLAAFLMSAVQSDGTITKEGKTTIVNTTVIGKNIEGYAGPTPVKIYIENNKVVKIETLRTPDGPKYVAKAKKVFEAFIGLPVKKAKKAKVDAVTGATYTSDALIENVRKGLDYYEKNK